MRPELREQLDRAYEVAQLAVALELNVHGDAVAIHYPGALRDEFLRRTCDDDVIRELLWREVHRYE